MIRAKLAAMRVGVTAGVLAAASATMAQGTQPQAAQPQPAQSQPAPRPALHVVPAPTYAQPAPGYSQPAPRADSQPQYPQPAHARPQYSETQAAAPRGYPQGAAGQPGAVRQTQFTQPQYPTNTGATGASGDDAGFRAGPVRPSAQVSSPAPTATSAGAAPAADGRMPVAGSGPAATRPRAPVAPFQLTPQEQQALDAVLIAWENRGKNVHTFKCEFNRLEYDLTFGTPDHPTTDSQGEIRYTAPDKGLFAINSMKAFKLVDAAAKKYERVEMPADYREKWICDGLSIYEFSPAKRQVIERKLPPELQGKAIADGPLPFLFGSDAARLKQRYFMRLVTPAGQTGTIWIESHPKYQVDAANFKTATLIVNEKNLAPEALEIVDPSAERATKITRYMFSKTVENSKLEWISLDHFKPRTPLGWTRVTETVPGAPAPGGNAGGPPANNGQAQRPGPTPR